MWVYGKTVHRTLNAKTCLFSLKWRHAKISVIYNKGNAKLITIFIDHFPLCILANSRWLANTDIWTHCRKCKLVQLHGKQLDATYKTFILKLLFLIPIYTSLFLRLYKYIHMYKVTILNFLHLNIFSIANTWNEICLHHWGMDNNTKIWPGMVAHTFISSTQEAKTGVFLWFRRQCVLHMGPVQPGLQWDPVKKNL